MDFLKNIKSFKIVNPPFDLEPQTISEALVAARRTVEFQRTIPPYSKGLKKLKTLISQQISESEIFAGEKKCQN